MYIAFFQNKDKKHSVSYVQSSIKEQLYRFLKEHNPSVYKLFECEDEELPSLKAKKDRMF